MTTAMWGALIGIVAATGFWVPLWQAERARAVGLRRLWVHFIDGRRVLYADDGTEAGRKVNAAISEYVAAQRGRGA